jgi:hypothetical protein
MLLILSFVLQGELMEVVDFYHQAWDFPTQWQQCTVAYVPDIVICVAGGTDGGGGLLDQAWDFPMQWQQ